MPDWTCCYTATGYGWSCRMWILSACCGWRPTDRPTERPPPARPPADPPASPPPHSRRRPASRRLPARPPPSRLADHCQACWMVQVGHFHSKSQNGLRTAECPGTSFPNIHIYIYIHIYTNIYIYICTYACKQVHIHVHTDIVSQHTGIYIYIYILE